MRYFDTPDGVVRAIESGQEGLIAQDWSELSPAELEQRIGPTLEERKLRKRREIESRRQAAIEAGFLHGAIPVQTGPQDRENLQGLTTAAQLRKATADTTPLDFRDADNAMHSLTPDEVIALGLAAMAHVQAQYQYSWTLKAQVDAAASPADLDAITW